MRFLLTLALGVFCLVNAFAQTTRALRPAASSTGAMALELNGATVGTVRSIAGGAVYGEVISDARPGANSQVNKRIGGVRYEPLTVEVGLDMSPAFWDIVRQWPATSKRLSGAVLVGDANLRLAKRLEFTNAVITEIETPPLDAADPRKPFTLLVTLQPERLISRPATGTLAVLNTKARQAFCSNFRVVIDGVDTARVSKVDSFSIKQNVMENALGDLRRPGLEQSTPECGDLVLTIPEAYSTSLDSWFQDSVIKGTGKERDIRLELLDATLKNVLMTVNLRGVGIWKLGLSEQPASTNILSMMDARLYVEGAVIDIK